MLQYDKSAGSYQLSKVQLTMVDVDTDVVFLGKNANSVIAVDSSGYIYVYGENGIDESYKFLLNSINIGKCIDSAIIGDSIYFLVTDDDGYKKLASCPINDDGTLGTPEDISVVIESDNTFNIENSLEIFGESGNVFIHSDDGKIHKFQIITFKRIKHV